MVSKRKVLLIITGLFLFGAIGRFAREDKPKSKIKAKEASAKSTKPTSNKENNVVAWEIAKAFVEDRLKSPSTAEFPWSMQGPDVNVTYDGNGAYRVLGYVDSHNDFSAITRTHFICELKNNGDEIWSLKNLIFNA